MADQEYRGRYLYAVIDAQAVAELELKGINDGPVHLVAEAGIAAVVSDVPDQKLRPQRKNIMDHNRVISGLMARTTPLPVSMGIIAHSEADVREMLQKHADAFREQLDQVAGCVEMSLKISLDVDNIFEYFVEADTDLREARDAMFAGGREPSQQEKIDLGQLFEQAMQDARERHTARVTETLEPASVKVKEMPCRTEAQISHLICLVKREHEAKWEAALMQAAEAFDDNFRFDYNGPFAPFSFVELEVDIGSK